MTIYVATCNAPAGYLHREGETGGPHEVGWGPWLPRCGPVAGEPIKTQTPTPRLAAITRYGGHAIRSGTPRTSQGAARAHRIALAIKGSDARCRVRPPSRPCPTGVMINRRQRPDAGRESHDHRGLVQLRRPLRSMITGSRARACVRAPAFRAHGTGPPAITEWGAGAVPAALPTGLRARTHGGSARVPMGPRRNSQGYIVGIAGGAP
jgi:hypothetical protein